VPAEICIIEALPVSATGKIDKGGLQVCVSRSTAMPAARRREDRRVVVRTSESSSRRTTTTFVARQQRQGEKLVTVYVLGGSQTDFSTKWARAAEHPLLALLGAASHGALENADVRPSEVQTAHVANFIAESAVHQSHLGAMLPMLDPAWSALPTSRHEAACASGSVAVLAAAAELEAGRYDVALVVGVELMRDLGDVDASQLLGAAAWTAGEPFDKALPWPDLFDRIGATVKQRYGLDRGHLTRIAELNRNNAKNNPLAQSRSWELTPEMIAADNAANPSSSAIPAGSNAA
jgi:acetyl-CoA C-acetyltransferase